MKLVQIIQTPGKLHLKLRSAWRSVAVKYQMSKYGYDSKSPCALVGCRRPESSPGRAWSMHDRASPRRTLVQDSRVEGQLTCFNGKSQMTSGGGPAVSRQPWALDRCWCWRWRFRALRSQSPLCLAPSPSPFPTLTAPPSDPPPPLEFLLLPQTWGGMTRNGVCVCDT